MDMKQIGKYFSMVKFSHTIFALPFALFGFTAAIYRTEFDFAWFTLGAVLICMVTARNAAMGFNRYLDRDIDKANPRTATVREIPSGVIMPSSALAFVIVNLAVFWITTWFINPLCFLLAPIVLFILLFYSYTKRFTSWCHLVLGLGLAIAPFAAWIAVTGEWSFKPLFISLGVLTWVSGFDIIYALQDQEFDKEQGLHSVPARFGKSRALRISEFLHFVTIAALAYGGYVLEMNTFYLIGLGIFSALLIYQHTLVKPNDLSRVNLAFFTTNGLASLIFGITGIADLIFFT